MAFLYPPPLITRSRDYVPGYIPRTVTCRCVRCALPQPRIGKIIIAIVGALVLITVIIVLLVCVKKHPKGKRTTLPKQPREEEEAQVSV